MLGAADNVVGHAGPIATRIAEPAILQAPDRCTGVCECSAQMSGMVEVVSISPESAMDENDGWMRPVAVRKKEIAELLGFLDGPGRTRTCARRIMSPLL